MNFEARIEKFVTIVLIITYFYVFQRNKNDVDNLLRHQKESFQRTPASMTKLRKALSNNQRLDSEEKLHVIKHNHDS